MGFTPISEVVVVGPNDDGYRCSSEKVGPVMKSTYDRVSLPEDFSNGKLRCIHFQFILAVLVGGNEYWGGGNNVDECI